MLVLPHMNDEPTTKKRSVLIVALKLLGDRYFYDMVI